MLWLLVVGLLGWSTFLTLRLNGLRDRTQGLERRLPELKDQLERAAATPATRRKAASVAAAPLAEADPAPILISTDETVADVTPVNSPPARERRTSGPPAQEVVRRWLEENGLAWAGGAALALGGLFLVTYAAQRGVFTPSMRIASAVALGTVLVVVSEWLKRRSGHALAAALAAGAGAATLYGAAWASHGLYGLIGAGVAGALLATASLGLLALAFRHGEPLALLALVGGFLAPAVTGLTLWEPLSLTGYLVALTLTGVGVAALRGWGRAGLLTVIGCAVWGLLALAGGDAGRTAVLAVGPIILIYAVVEWWKRRGQLPGIGGSGELNARLPAIALLIGALLLAGLWSVAPARGLAAAGLGTLALLALAALGVRRDLIPPALQLAAYAVASAATLWAGSHPVAGVYQLWLPVLLLGTAIAGVASALARQETAAKWAGAAPAAVLLLAITMSPLPALGWIPEASGAIVLLCAAAMLARTSADPSRALAPAIWIWTAGAAALAALNEAIDPRFLPLATAGLALGVAGLHVRLAWRGFAAVTLAAALATVAALASPLMFEALQAGDLAWPVFAVVAAVAAGLIFASARFTGRLVTSRPSAEALSTGGLVVLLIGGVLLLRPWGPAGGIDPLVEASLRTLMILVAGLTAALATPVAVAPEDRVGAKVLPGLIDAFFASVVGHEPPGVIGRWRGQALLLLGIAHGLVCQVLWFNPLWATWTPAVAGPPILDSLVLGYLGPAGLLAAATVARVSIHRTLLAIYGLGAAVFAFVWQLIEVRRLFQGASLHAGADSIGRAEMAVYAVLLLLSAASTLWLGHLAARRRLTISTFANEIMRSGRVGAWFALAVAILVFGFSASPWWGPIDRPLEGPLAVALLLGVYAIGAGLPLVFASRLENAEDRLLLRAMRLGGVTIVFAFLNLVIRWAFRGGDMRPDLREASLETWTFSAAWALYGFGLLVYGVARRNSDLRGAGLVVLLVALAKIFLFDMSRLDGMVRAGSFLAVGALLLAAAVIVRRLGGRAGLALGRTRDPDT